MKMTKNFAKIWRRFISGYVYGKLLSHVVMKRKGVWSPRDELMSKFRPTCRLLWVGCSVVQRQNCQWSCPPASQCWCYTPWGSRRQWYFHQQLGQLCGCHKLPLQPAVGSSCEKYGYGDLTHGWRVEGPSHCCLGRGWAKWRLATKRISGSNCNAWKSWSLKTPNHVRNWELINEKQPFDHPCRDNLSNLILDHPATML
jgi:hypothetical protein